MKGYSGFHHVSLAVQNEQIYVRTVEFYSTVLGMPVIRSWSRGNLHITLLDMGNAKLEIVRGAEGQNTGVINHIALEVESPEAAEYLLNRCLDGGCTLQTPCRTTKTVDDQQNPVCYCNGFCLGLAGERIEVLWMEN